VGKYLYNKWGKGESYWRVNIFRISQERSDCLELTWVEKNERYRVGKKKAWKNGNGGKKVVIEKKGKSRKKLKSLA